MHGLLISILLANLNSSGRVSEWFSMELEPNCVEKQKVTKIKKLIAIHLSIP